MGNINNLHLIKKEKNSDLFRSIDESHIEDLRLHYKIIDVDYLDPILVNSKMFANNYFEIFPMKKKMVNNMLNYYLNHVDNEIYKKTNYLCKDKEKICICNQHANDLRKIYDGINYKPSEKYISWFNFY